MVPLARAASLTKTFGVAYCPTVTRRPGLAKGELSVRPRDSQTTKPDVRSSLVSGHWSCGLASGFTLIEMIVVMLVIAVLAALVMGAATSVFDRARRVQAKNDVTQISNAVNAFYTEYGRYPVAILAPANDAFFGSGATPAGCTSYGNNDVLLDVLRSNTDPAGPNLGTVNSLNPRQIAFLAPSGAKNTTPPRGGIATDRRYYDPWGTQYAIVIDTNYDNTLTNPYSDTDGSAGNSPLRFGAIAYSYGKNGNLGGGAAFSSSFAVEGGSTGLFKGSSDVYSW